MIAMLRLQFIIFALIGIGFYARRKGMVGREGQKNITDLVIRVILPCNIVTSFVQELPASALRDCITIFLISVCAEIMCMLYSKLAYRNVEERRRKCLTYGILVSNAGFLGNPVAEGVYGPLGLMLASVYLIPVRVIMWSKGIALFGGESNRRETVKKVITHPCVLACMVGVVIMLAELFAGQPAPDDRKVQHGAVHDGDRHDPVRYRAVAAAGQAGAPLHGREAAHCARDTGDHSFFPEQDGTGIGAFAAAVCPARSDACPCDDEHALVQV